MKKITVDTDELRRAAADGDLSRLSEIVHDLSSQIVKAGGSVPSAIVPYGVGSQETPIPPYGTAIQDRGVRPLYGVVDQVGSVVPLYGLPPNPVPLYGVIIHDAAVSGDLARMKAIASGVEKHLKEVKKMNSIVERWSRRKR